MLLTAGVALSLGVGNVYGAPLSAPPRVLILDETVVGSATSLEALAASSAIPGCVVDIVSAANWPFIPATGLGGPTGYGFDSYRALIIGDPICNNYSASYLYAMTVLNSTKLTWTPVCSGNVIIEGVDNALHDQYGANTNGAAKTLERGIGFAVADTNRTGFYYAMSCYYDVGPTNAVLVPHLTAFGTFMTRNYGGVCFNDCHIVATHPIFTAPPIMSDADLSGWGCSTHEGFDVWPPNFIPLAIALTNGAFTASDGSNGVPYIVVRGEGVKVKSSIEINPPLATNNVGTPHTVCATLATNVFPKAGVAVTFTIVSGPNSVTNYTTLTDGTGTACFTYTGLGGPGTDYITASYLGTNDIKNTSGPSAKIWAGACLGFGCNATDCLADGSSWSWQICVTNLTASPVTSLSLSGLPAGINITPSTILLSPILNPGQATNLTFTVTSMSGPTNFCVLFTAIPEGGAGGAGGGTPCQVPYCLSLAACCNRVLTNQMTYTTTIAGTNYFNLQLTIQNITATPIKFVGLAADANCVTFNPPLVNLTLPAYGGPSPLFPTQTRTINIQVLRSTPCPGTNYFYLSTFNSNLVACCSSRLKLPTPKCISIIIPIDKAVVLTNTPVAFKAIATPTIINPCPFGTVIFYANAVAVGVADHEPYETTFTPTMPGAYTLTAVGMGTSGEFFESDPVELDVVEPPPTHNHFGPPGSLTAGVTGNTVSLNLLTEPGHQYTIEYRTNLSSGGWAPLTNFVGDGMQRVIQDSVTNDRSRYYRAVLQH